MKKLVLMYENWQNLLKDIEFPIPSHQDDILAKLNALITEYNALATAEVLTKEQALPALKHAEQYTVPGGLIIICGFQSLLFSHKLIKQEFLNLEICNLTNPQKLMQFYILRKNPIIEEEMLISAPALKFI